MKHSIQTAAMILPILLLVSPFANAKTDLDAIQACSEEISIKIEKKQGAAVRLRIDESGFDSTERLSGGTTTFDMNAVDALTDNVIGRFRCQVDGRGRVMQLRTLMLDVSIGQRRYRDSM